MDQGFEQYFEAMPCYVAVQDREFNVIRANRRFRRDFGPIQHRKCFQIYKGRNAKCDICPVERTFRDGECHRVEGAIRRIDGKLLSVIVDSTPIRDEAGDITHVMSMTTDITDIKNLQNEVRESEERYRRLFEGVPCYISIQDRDLNLIQTNRAFRDSFGPHTSRKCFEVYKHRREECYPCPVRETFCDGKSHTREELVVSQSGDRRNVLVTTNPIRDAEGRLISVMEMSADITQVRQLQDQLSSLGLLIGSISHSLKGLLNGLGGGMYMLDTGLARQDDERVTKGWDMVRRNVDRIRSMVFNILYYAKDRDPARQTITVKDLLGDVCNVMRPRIQEQGLLFDCEIDCDDEEFEVDPDALRSLLVNLLENAVDACRIDRDDDQHLVSFHARTEADDILFEIEDNGIGMDRETREKAFSLFYSSKGLGGTGLGLFVANRIALAHGGSIDLRSEPGKGTRLLVKIPRHPLPGPPLDPPLS